MTPADRPAAPTDRFSREPAMTTVRTTPARVRTDAALAAHAAPVVAPTEPRPGPGSPEARAGTGAIRALGVGLAVGATAYAIPFMIFGGQETGIGRFMIDLSGVFFQLGVFCLLAAMWRTRATGTTRLARSMIVVESVVLGVATVQSLLTLPAMGGEWSTAATVLDPFWPLSMLGMAVLGVKVAVAGRWRGALRAWPVVAETWVFVALPAMALLGPTVGSVVAGGHFIVGYGVLGVLLAVRPDLTTRG
ncbi:hypothetical protein [Actinomycetospora sp. CA-053990]|uniref:hypothetical protein n=1 Tax=Actinomycetospora sp. CA-053990 TaxID=3239891 RepID=UPI003D935583